MKHGFTFAGSRWWLRWVIWSCRWWTWWRGQGLSSSSSSSSSSRLFSSTGSFCVWFIIWSRFRVCAGFTGRLLIGFGSLLWLCNSFLLRGCLFRRRNGYRKGFRCGASCIRGWICSWSVARSLRRFCLKLCSVWLALSLFFTFFSACFWRWLGWFVFGISWWGRFGCGRF